MKARCASGRLAAAFVLLIASTLGAFGASSVSPRFFDRDNTVLSDASRAPPTGEVHAALRAPDGQREQAVRNTADTPGAGFAAETAQFKRIVVTQSTNPSSSPRDPGRSRIRAVIERRAAVAMLLAFVVSGAGSAHTTSLPPPHNA